MTEAGYRFTVVEPPLAEPNISRSALSPEECAEALSYFKARSVRPVVDMGLIIGADTVVALNDQIYGKPTDLNDARRILQRLSGTQHRVITGLTLLDACTNDRRVVHDVTYVAMRPMQTDELERYLASGAWRGKAGAYGIQDQADAYVDALEGSYSNVVGLPLELLADQLKRSG